MPKTDFRGNFIVKINEGRKTLFIKLHEKAKAVKRDYLVLLLILLIIVASISPIVKVYTSTPTDRKSSELRNEAAPVTCTVRESGNKDCVANIEQKIPIKEELKVEVAKKEKSEYELKNEKYPEPLPVVGAGLILVLVLLRWLWREPDLHLFSIIPIILRKKIKRDINRLQPNP